MEEDKLNPKRKGKKFKKGNKRRRKKEIQRVRLEVRIIMCKKRGRTGRE
jgi:hypothetical protein